MYSLRICREKNGFPSRTTRFPISLIRHLSLIRLFSSSCPEEHSRVSIDFSLLRQDNGRWQVHMCVCVCVSVHSPSLRLQDSHQKNTGKPKTKQRNACGMGVVYEIQKNKKHWEKCQSTDSVFGTIWSTMNPKERSENGHFSRRNCTCSYDLSTFSDVGPTSNAQKRHFFTAGSTPSVPINETPSIRYDACAVARYQHVVASSSHDKVLLPA